MTYRGRERAEHLVETIHGYGVMAVTIQQAQGSRYLNKYQYVSGEIQDRVSKYPGSIAYNNSQYDESSNILGLNGPKPEIPATRLCAKHAGQSLDVLLHIPPLCFQTERLAVSARIPLGTAALRSGSRLIGSISQIRHRWRFIHQVIRIWGSPGQDRHSSMSKPLAQLLAS